MDYCLPSRETGRSGQASEAVTELEYELARVKRELTEVKIEPEILKKGGDLLREDVAMKYGRVTHCDSSNHGCLFAFLCARTIFWQQDHRPAAFG